MWIESRGRACYEVQQTGGAWLSELFDDVKVGRLAECNTKRLGDVLPVYRWRIAHHGDLLKYLTTIYPAVRQKRLEVLLTIEYLRGNIPTEFAIRMLRLARLARKTSKVTK